MLFLNAGRYYDENRLRNKENTLLMENKRFVEEMETDYFIQN